MHVLAKIQRWVDAGSCRGGALGLYCLNFVCACFFQFCAPLSLAFIHIHMHDTPGPHSFRWTRPSFLTKSGKGRSGAVARSCGRNGLQSRWVSGRGVLIAKLVAPRMTLFSHCIPSPYTPAQERMRSEPIEITYSYWDGSGNRSVICTKRCRAAALGSSKRRTPSLTHAPHTCPAGKLPSIRATPFTSFCRLASSSFARIFPSSVACRRRA